MFPFLFMYCLQSLLSSLMASLIYCRKLLGLLCLANLSFISSFSLQQNIKILVLQVELTWVQIFWNSAVQAEAGPFYYSFDSFFFGLLLFIRVLKQGLESIFIILVFAKYLLSLLLVFLKFINIDKSVKQSLNQASTFSLRNKAIYIICFLSTQLFI